MEVQLIKKIIIKGKSKTLITLKFFCLKWTKSNWNDGKLFLMGKAIDVLSKEEIHEILQTSINQRAKIETLIT